MGYIELNNITKDYGDTRGIFDIALSIEKGESFGFIGINGAGKTTTIRHLMGFLKAQKGIAIIDNLDCWKNSAEIKKKIGYIPGEIYFPDAKTGLDFIKQQAKLLNITDMSYADYLIDKLQLDPTANLKRMSKGMKQKTAIVAALMREPEILILDEPTTGLDPLMRIEFMEIIEEQRIKGITIFMSSNMFDEVERLCDRVASIKDGKIIDVKPVDLIKQIGKTTYIIDFETAKEYQRFLSSNFKITKISDEENQVVLTIKENQTNKLLNTLKEYKIKSISEKTHTLEEYFNGLYEREDK